MNEKRSVKEVFESQGYRKPGKRLIIASIILLLGIIIFLAYYLFYYYTPCYEKECFEKAILKCKRVSWTKDDAQSSWFYRIYGNAQGESCRIEVTLVKMKHGTTDSERLQGKQMICTHKKGETRFPEENIKDCSGALKEEMQDIIIQRMHNYLLKNVGEIKTEFTKV